MRFSNFFKRIFPKKNKRSIGMSGMSVTQAKEILLRYPNAIILGSKEQIEEIKSK